MLSHFLSLSPLTPLLKIIHEENKLQHQAKTCLQPVHSMPRNVHVAQPLALAQAVILIRCLLSFLLSLSDPEAFPLPMETSTKAKIRPTFPSTMEEREKE